MEIKKGDVFLCKRRGHEVKIFAVSDSHACYKNIRGREVRIPLSRLEKPFRFRLVQSDGCLAEPVTPA